MTEVSKIKNNLVIKLADYVSGEIIWSIIGNEHIDDSLFVLFMSTNELKLIPQVVIDNIADRSKFSIRQERDSFDYLYDIKALATMGGQIYKKKRNKANRARSLIKDIKVVNDRKISLEQAHNFRLVFQKWLENNNKQSEDFKAENSAVLRFLNFSDSFKVINTQIYSKNKLVAFSFNEILANGYAICHFEKALTVHQDIYPFLVQESAKALLKEGCKILNWEQDLGIEGLRQAKLSYHPMKMLKKYTIKLA